MRICSIEGCQRKHHSHDLCHMHVSRLQRLGTTGQADPIQHHIFGQVGCSAKACNEPHWANGYCQRHGHIARCYGVNVDWYDQQRSLGCQICGSTIDRFTIDHDHRCCSGEITCGKCVRGVICRQCNLMLGGAKDQIEILQAGINYLMSRALKEG